MTPHNPPPPHAGVRPGGKGAPDPTPVGRVPVHGRVLGEQTWSHTHPYPPRPPPPPPIVRGSGGYPTYSPPQVLGKGGWVTQKVIGYPTELLPSLVLASLGISAATVHSFVSAMQVVVLEGVVASLTSPSPAAPAGRVVALLLLHLRFACGVAGDEYLSPIL